MTGDGPLFAGIIADGTALVWTNTLGTGAPFYWPAQTLVEAVETAPHCGCDAGAQRCALGLLGRAQARTPLN